MNREILFRGKRPDTGGWVYGYYCKHIKRQVCPMGGELKPEDIAHLIINDGFADWNMPRSLQGYDVDPETVGQYTGLMDKNGVEIYEGDIVRNELGEVFSVEYLGEHWFGYVIQTGETWCGHLYEYDEYEVIGNIYDNPEMLEVS
jgi:uncharacterized phage protein (TIGR01671 family)